MSKKAEIKWKPKWVEISKIKKTPNNYKIKSDLGKERLSISMKLFGNASTVIVNTDFHLIDGNSRLEEERTKGTKFMWVMWPSRKLTPKEYKEFSVMFDYAKAGEVDIDRADMELGTSKEYYEKFKREMPVHLLDKMGKNSKGISVDLAKVKYPDAKGDAVSSGESLLMIQLFYNVKDANVFRKLEEKFAKKFKTRSTPETVLQVFKKFK